MTVSSARELGLNHTHSLLSLLGADVSRHTLDERLGPVASQERWAELVRAHGFAARLVRVDDRALARLPMPTLLFREGVPAHLVREVRGREVLVEQPGGNQARLRTQDVLATENCALEVQHVERGQTRIRARLLSRTVGESKSLLQLIALTILLSALGLIGPALTREAMDHALPDRASALLLAVSLGLVLSGLARASLSYLRDLISTRLSARTAHALSRDGLSHALGTSYASQRRKGLGALLQFVSSTEAGGRQLLSLGMRPLLDGLLLVVNLVAMLSVSWQLACAVLLGSLVVMALSSLLARSHAACRRTQLAATARERAHLHEMVAGIATVQAAGAESSVLRRWLVPMLDQSVARLHGDFLATWHALAFMWLGRAMRMGVFVWGAKACLAGELSVGGYVALAMYTEAFAGSLTSLGDANLMYWSCRAELEKVDDVLAEPSHPLVDQGSERPAAGDDAVLMHDVWFRYGPDEPWILKGYNLRVKRGEQLTLRSASGSGKTTILRLIAGLYTPERGTVSVFGRDPSQVKNHVAYLPQHAHLFAGSLLHNLRLLSGATLERVVEACRGTGLSALVATLPMQLETVVPAGGGNLSGGQRQWILLTAAVASDRSLLLMDESLSALDRLTRVRIKRGVSFENKTVVWVSHED